MKILSKLVSVQVVITVGLTSVAGWMDGVQTLGDKAIDAAYNEPGT